MALRRVRNLLITVIVCLSATAHAYVEPDVPTSFHHLVYWFIFAFMAVWIFRPFSFLKKLFKRESGEEEACCKGDEDQE